MKLQTSIKPRASGTVTLAGLNGVSYIFEKDVDGALVCDVDHDATVAVALETGNFFPSDEGDYQQALTMTSAGADVDAGADADPGDDGSDDEFPAGTLPVEADTPPKVGAKPRKAK